MFDDADLVADAESRIGMILCGKYRLDSILGVGGMATVYAATHRNNAELAIKILHHALDEDPVVRERFLREAYVANRVKHRNVVKIVDDDVAEDGSAFLVMDRIKGASVEDLRDPLTGRVGLHAGVAIVEQLLDVLAAAHAQGIVHRDVKPANLFVTTDGELKVLDFGIARMREALATDLSLTGAATVVGTPSYMAPEQASPGMADVDARTDVWAAGATLFTLISGRPVHEGETAQGVMLRAAVDSSRPLATVAPRVPRAIAEVVDCALAFNMSRRWGSAEAMRTALLAAYRFHYRRSPSWTSLLALLDRRDIAPASTERVVRPESRSVIETRPTDPAPPMPPRDSGTLRSRTSIPTATDFVPSVTAPRKGTWVGGMKVGWLLGALVAIGAASTIGQRLAMVEELQGSQVAPPVADEPYRDASTLRDQ